MTDADDWESVSRETLHWALMCLLEDANAVVEPMADTVYWDQDVSEDQVEAMRQLAFEFEYVTEEYVARLCERTEPWSNETERTPTHLPSIEE